MTDSERTQPETPDAPVARPSWRFSGRRGTPVHMRERTPATLPPEITQIVTQMARERAGEQQAKAEQPPTKLKVTSTRAAKSTMRLPGSERQTPPVAGAPLPVERRTRGAAAEAAVTTTPIEAVPAPEERPVSEEVAALTAEANETREAGARDEADRQRDAKARAKARAKAEREAAEEAEGKRRLFAAGREVDPASQEVAVEPLLAPAPAVDTEPAAEVEVEVEAELVELPAASTEPAAAAEAAVDGPYLLETLEPIPTTYDAPSAAPDPTIATEGASQAAWELGRLPFLLPRSAFDEQPPAGATPAAKTPDLEPIVELDIPRAAREEDAILRPIEWAPVDEAPEPAPIAADVPQRGAPKEIAVLGEPLHVPRRDEGDRLSARAGARVELGHGRGTIDSADARRRVVERRAQLDELVAELAALGARHTD